MYKINISNPFINKMLQKVSKPKRKVMKLLNFNEE